MTFWAWITAVSVSGSVPRILAVAVRAVVEGTRIVPALPATSTTWLLVRILPSELRMMPEPEPDSCGPVTSILTTEGSTCCATCSTEPLGAVPAGALTTCEVVRPSAKPVVEPGCHSSQAAAPPTPAAPPTSSEAVTTDAANAPRRGRRPGGVPPGPVAESGAGAGAGAGAGGKRGDVSFMAPTMPDVPVTHLRAAGRPKRRRGRPRGRVG